LILLPLIKCYCFEFQSFRHFAPCSTLDFAKYKAILEENAKRCHTLEPLEETVHYLKDEVYRLKARVSQQTLHNYNVSLMDELNHATSRSQN
jgi:hypothetical protein